MKPIQYTETPSGYKFHYSFTQLREFLVRGHAYGDTGMLLIEKTDDWMNYRGFGTIEHPFKQLTRLTLKYNAALDGGEFSIEAVMNPKPYLIPDSYRMVMVEL